MTETAKVAHFSITGAAFTKLVRARMRDDAPGAAFRLASSIIADDPLDQLAVPSFAIRLCNGTAKMRGDQSDLQLVDDETKAAEAYRKRLKWLYAGRIRVGTLWYQPVAYVTDVGPRDVGCEPRAKHYCSADEVVLEHAGFPDPQFPSIKREVIFGLCGERPHWHEVPRGHQEALDEYLAAGRKLQERGHSKLYRNEVSTPGWLSRGASKETSGETLEEMDARLEREDAEEKASRLRRVADLRVLILAQAGDDLIEFSWPEARKRDDEEVKVAAGSVMIPRAPFMVWAFAKLEFLKIQLPEWKPISPSGMKMQMDNEWHTDWIIGGGFDPLDREFYWGGVYAKAAEDLRAKIQDEHDDRRRAEEEKVTTLVAGPTVQGPVHHGKMNKASPAGSIVVLPNLNPKYLVTVANAAAVITEEGGEVAHLAQIGRERGLPIVRRSDARERFSEHDLVEVNAEARTARTLKYYNDASNVEDDDD